VVAIAAHLANIEPVPVSALKTGLPDESGWTITNERSFLRGKATYVKEGLWGTIASLFGYWEEVDQEVSPDRISVLLKDASVSVKAAPDGCGTVAVVNFKVRLQGYGYLSMDTAGTDWTSDSVTISCPCDCKCDAQEDDDPCLYVGDEYVEECRADLARQQRELQMRLRDQEMEGNLGEAE
jgi:hypothetical protein